MKNIGKLLLIAAIVLLIAIQAQSQTGKSATGQSDQKQPTTTSTPGTFVDKDNNGVCDNYESRSGNGRGANYVDKNGDGVCDNRSNVGKKPSNSCRNGQGNKYRHGQGRGQRNCCRR